jgi:hypothetical protein
MCFSAKSPAWVHRPTSGTAWYETTFSSCAVAADGTVSPVEIKPATNGRNDPASEFYAKCCEERGIFLSNKPDINKL